jgi:hypothetical protein
MELFVGKELDIVVRSGVARCSSVSFNKERRIDVTVLQIDEGIATLSNGEKWDCKTLRPVSSNDKLRGSEAVPLHRRVGRFFFNGENIYDKI